MSDHQRKEYPLPEGWAFHVTETGAQVLRARGVDIARKRYIHGDGWGKWVTIDLNDEASSAVLEVIGEYQAWQQRNKNQKIDETSEKVLADISRRKGTG